MEIIIIYKYFPFSFGKRYLRNYNHLYNAFYCTFGSRCVVPLTLFSFNLTKTHRF
jgi:hypothetical protein